MKLNIPIESKYASIIDDIRLNCQDILLELYDLNIYSTIEVSIFLYNISNNKTSKTYIDLKININNHKPDIVDSFFNSLDDDDSAFKGSIPSRLLQDIAVHNDHTWLEEKKIEKQNEIINDVVQRLNDYLSVYKTNEKKISPYNMDHIFAVL